MKEKATSVLLKLFINGNERCHTTEAQRRMSRTYLWLQRCVKPSYLFLCYLDLWDNTLVEQRFKKLQIAEVRAVQLLCGNAVKTLCNRHAAAFILNMLKTNAAAWRLNPCHTRVASLQRSHSVKKNAERQGARCVNASNAVETLWKRCAIA